MSVVAHFFMSVGSSEIHERLAHFFIDFYTLTEVVNISIFSGCRKTPQKTDATEQRGVCAGGKKPTARSIKQDFETFLKVSKSAQRGEKTFSTR